MAKKKDDKAALFIPAGLFLGLGIIGGVYANWAAGALIGLGVGFAAYAIAKLLK